MTKDVLFFILYYVYICHVCFIQMKEGEVNI